MPLLHSPLGWNLHERKPCILFCGRRVDLAIHTAARFSSSKRSSSDASGQRRRSRVPAFDGALTRRSNAPKSALQPAGAVLLSRPIPSVSRCGHLMPDGSRIKKVRSHRTQRPIDGRFVMSRKEFQGSSDRRPAQSFLRSCQTRLEACRRRLRSSGIGSPHAQGSAP